jgi:hypothetical protein
MQKLVPYYGYDGRYLDHISVARAKRLEMTGRVKVVRHPKGHINRVILLRGKNDPKAARLRDYLGRAYSFRQELDDGHRLWKLCPLQGGHSESSLAPEFLRPIFIRVLLDVLAA